MRKCTRLIARSGILGIAVLAASSGPSFADLITYTFDTGLSSTDWATTLSIPQFGTPGTLNSVAISLDGTVSGLMKVANTGTFVSAATQPSLPTVGTPASKSGTLTSGSKIITGIASTSNLFVGEKISGTGVPAGATIASIDSGTQIKISSNATASGLKTLSLSCAGLTTCSVWNLSYHAAPPSTIPTNTVDSNISAAITLHVGSNLMATLPSVSATDTLDYGPQYSPDTYNFTKTYNGAPLTQTAAQALAPNAAGITPLGGIPAPSGGTPQPCFAIYGACTVGGNTYNVGVSHLGLSNTASSNLLLTNPLDLALFIGNGFLDVPIDAYGYSSHTGAGNISFLSSTSAQGNVTVTYDYTEYVPEPGSLGLLGSGLTALGVFSRRKRKKPAQPENL
jgi:hypothetical protein